MASTADALGTATEIEQQPKPGEPSTPTAEEQPIQTPPAEPQETPEGKPNVEAEPEAEETEVDLDAQPESSGDFAKYKETFKQFPELRNILGRESAYSELGTFSEVKEIINRIPSLADAEEMATQAENHRLMGEMLRNDPASFYESLRESDSNAASQLARKLPEILAETDTHLYSEQARFYTNNVLDNLAAMAQQSGDKELYDALALVASKGLGYRLGGTAAQPVRASSETERLRKELADRDRQQQSQQSESFWNEANQSYLEAIASEIEADLRKSLPDATDATIQRIGSETWTLLNQRLKDQPQTMARINQYKQAVTSGRISQSDFRAIVDYSLNRARLVKGSVIKDVLKDWSENIIRVNKKDLETKKGIAARGRDVGTGVQATNSTAQTGNGKPERKSVNSILDRIAQGTYQAKR